MPRFVASPGAAVPVPQQVPIIVDLHILLTAQAVAAVRSAEVLAVVDSAVAHIAVDSMVVVLAAVVPSAEAHTAVGTAVAATAAVAVAEWVDIGNSEHQFPDFSIRHLQNLAH